MGSHFTNDDLRPGADELRGGFDAGGWLVI
jgi:hypothetical protein